MKAYILFEVDSGKVKNVLNKLVKIDEVIQFDCVSGMYDVVALVEAADVKDLGSVIVDQIQTIDGVRKTITLNVIHF